MWNLWESIPKYRRWCLDMDESYSHGCKAAMALTIEAGGPLYRLFMVYKGEDKFYVRNGRHFVPVVRDRDGFTYVPTGEPHVPEGKIWDIASQTLTLRDLVTRRTGSFEHSNSSILAEAESEISSIAGARRGVLLANMLEERKEEVLRYIAAQKTVDGSWDSLLRHLGWYSSEYLPDTSALQVGLKNAIEVAAGLPVRDYYI